MLAFFLIIEWFYIFFLILSESDRCLSDARHPLDPPLLHPAMLPDSQTTVQTERRTPRRVKSVALSETDRVRIKLPTPGVVRTTTHEPVQTAQLSLVASMM